MTRDRRTSAPRVEPESTRAPQDRLPAQLRSGVADDSLGQGERSFGDHHAAEVLLRLVRRRAAAKLSASSRSADDEIADEGDSGNSRIRAAIRTEPPAPKPADVAAAVIVGRALEGRRAPIRELLVGAPVIMIRVQNQETASAVAALIRRAFYDRLTPPNSDRDPDVRRGVCTVPAAGDTEQRHRYGVEKRVREALNGFVPIFVATAGQESDFPDFFHRLVEHRLVGGPFKPDDIHFVIRKVVGSTPSRCIAPSVAERITLPNLELVVHPRRTADGCLDMLENLARTVPAAAGPKLSEMAGYGLARTWGLDVASDLSAFARSEIGAENCPRGAILHGPPGVGKTIFARALAAEAGVPFFAGSLTEWQAQGAAHLGTTLKGMREFFQAASDNAPCVALIDELDGFGSRGRFGSDHEQYWVQLVNGLLELLDGASPRPGVVMIGATNHLERIDPAIRRAGRFDRTIEIRLPDAQDLEGIIRHHLRDDLQDAGLAAIAQEAAGLSGAEAAEMVRQARRRAHREHRPLAVDDLRIALVDDVEPLDPDVERMVAVHEAGHALVAIASGVVIRRISLGLRSPLFLGSIEPGALGGAVTAASCRRILRMAMGGRAAEIVAFGEPSAGAVDDLRKATELAGTMIFDWGLGGTLAVGGPRHGDTRVEHELRRALDDACSLLIARRRTLNALAQALIEKRRLDWSDIVAIAEEAGDGSPEMGSNPAVPPVA